MDRHAAAWCGQAFLVPLALVTAALVLHQAGLDRYVTDQFFDAATNVFPMRSQPYLEMLGHRWARTLATLVWLGTTVAALACGRVPSLRPYRRVLWSVSAAMALGPTVVVILKNTTSFPCPWDLAWYGGRATPPTAVFVSPARAGQCFPSGHSAGGFSFVAFYFAAIALRRRRLALLALALTLIAGSAFSAVRVVQGAHFVSHALWAAAIDWLVAALIFLPLTLGSRASQPGAPARQPPGPGEGRRSDE